MKPTPAAKIKGRALEPQQEDEGLEEEVGVLELEGFLEFLAMGEFKQRRRGSPASGDANPRHIAKAIRGNRAYGIEK